LPGIQEVAQPELRLAGVRINPRMHAASMFDFGNHMQLLDVQTGKIRDVKGLPPRTRIADTQWSPDERWIAFTLWADNGVELWVADVRQGSARRLLKDRLNTVMGSGFQWAQGADSLLVRLVPRNLRTMPASPLIPAGPNTLEARGGKTSQNRTYPDMLRNSNDADVFDWFANAAGDCQSERRSETHRTVMKLARASISPDGNWILTTQLRARIPRSCRGNVLVS
jgi:dipeptidyl aminopeptidase/acylaminoacyl peptidase